MPSFQDSAVLVILALILFGPKKLPVLARQLGKLMADFRRASNEFRTQMEEELRISEQADRQKQIAAIEAAAPVAPAIEATAAEPHEPPPAPNFASAAEQLPESDTGSAAEFVPDSPTEFSAGQPEATLPIATSGELSILPPASGLPIATASPTVDHSSPTQAHEAELEAETLHG